MTEVPGYISAFEPSTGLLVRGIKVNGKYAIVDECNVNPEQKIEQKFFIQGGPRAAIADIGTKHIEGQIKCPVRVGYFDPDDRTHLVLDPVVKNLLDNAQNPDTPLVIETNHVLSDIDVTAESWPTDNNKLLTMDSCLVKELTLTANDDGVELTASIVGMIDARNESDLIAPPEDYLLGRQLSFADCDASRFESDMRMITKIELQVKSDVQMPVFLMPTDITVDQRSDQPNCLGVASWTCEGNFEEVLRQGMEAETYIHGGFMVGENLQFQFGPFIALIKAPLFDISQQNLNHDFIKRSTKFKAVFAPQLRNPKGDLFSYS